MMEQFPDQPHTEATHGQGTDTSQRSLLRRSSRRLRANLKKIALVAVVVALGLAAYFYVNSPANVQVAVVKTITTAETLGASGKVQGERVADLGVDLGGIVRTIYVKEGDSVSTGGLILSLDKSQLDAQVQAQQDAVGTAQAELARAARGALPSEIAQARAELAQAQTVGAAKVRQAEAHLKDLNAAPAVQEVREAEAVLRQKRQALKKAQQDRDRIKLLAEQGAVSQSSLDDAQAAVDSAQTDVAVQQEKLSLLHAGPRAGLVDEANAAITEAKASLDTNVKAARARLNTLLASPRPEDVAAARTRLAEAQAGLRRIIDQRSKTDLRAPFAGVIASIPVESGQSVSPGQTVAVLYEMSRPIVVVETDEENLSVLYPGQTAIVSSDAFPGRTFRATLYNLGSQVNPERGTIQIKLRPLVPVTWLRPDLTVDVNIITKTNVRRIVLPADTVAKIAGRSTVMVVRDNKAVPVPVTTGAAGPTGVTVFGGLRDGDLVIRNAAGVAPNGDVNVVNR